VVDPANAEWLRRRLTPLPLNCYQVPIRLEHPLGNGLSKTYIACTNSALWRSHPEAWFRHKPAVMSYPKGVLLRAECLIV
jgi:hypothetical protein